MEVEIQIEFRVVKVSRDMPHRAVAAIQPPTYSKPPIIVPYSQVFKDRIRGKTEKVGRAISRLIDN